MTRKQAEEFVDSLGRDELVQAVGRSLYTAPGDFAAYSVPFGGQLIRYADAQGNDVKMHCVVFSGLLLSTNKALKAIRPVGTTIQDKETGSAIGCLLPDIVVGTCPEDIADFIRERVLKAFRARDEGLALAAVTERRELTDDDISREVAKLVERYDRLQGSDGPAANCDQDGQGVADQEHSPRVEAERPEEQHGGDSAVHDGSASAPERPDLELVREAQRRIRQLEGAMSRARDSIQVDHQSMTSVVRVNSSAQTSLPLSQFDNLHRLACDVDLILRRLKEELADPNQG